MIQSDADFCVHYAENIDPYAYYVLVCPKCRFAADKQRFTRKPNIDKQLLPSLQERAKTISQKLDFCEDRTPELVVRSYGLGFLWGQHFIPEAPFYLGTLHHRLAWYFRKNDNPDAELRQLEETVMLYAKAYETEHQLPDSLGPGGVEFLVAEIYRRLSHFDDSKHWLSRALEEAGQNMQPRIRRAWEDTLEQVRAQIST